ncbi:MAG: PqqD family protein [Tolypothrix carrinoi HA7290-LM1]|jgi:hypothetical protein|nr:PqqD family protein [Tolypothrix carrinoi HA7290-LM1]
MLVIVSGYEGIGIDSFYFFFYETAVLLDSRKNVYYTLNDSAVEFWKFLVQNGSFECVLKEVLELYEDSSDVISKEQLYSQPLNA